MNTPERMARLFDAQAPRFDAIYTGRRGVISRAWDALTRRNIHERFDFTMQALAPVAGKRVLDVGCGPGRYCIALADRGAKQVVGLDLSPRMLELATELATKAGVGDRCLFVQQDVLQYSPSEKFDAIVAMGFFDYIKDQAETMKHFRTLSQGPIVVSFPCKWSWRVPIRKLWWKLKGWEIVLSTRRSIVELCQKAGVSVDQLHRVGPLYLLVASPIGDNPAPANRDAGASKNES